MPCKGAAPVSSAAAGGTSGGSRQDSRRPSRGVEPAGKPTTQRPTTAVGYAAEQNARWRSYMEDDHAMVRELDGLASGSLWCGLYDGHGGRTAVDFVTNHLHAAFASEFAAGGRRDVPAALDRAFSRVDRMLVQAGAVQCGTTAAVVVYAPPAGPLGGRASLFVANVGDSRVVMLRSGPHSPPPLRLSIDHLPSNAGEVARVQQAGGAIVGNRVGGTLAITRALGDPALKGPGGGVSGEPSVMEHVVAEEDRYVLLASDGIWDVITDEQAQALVLAAEGAPPAEIARRLVDEALKKGTRDNVSALLV